VVVVQMLIVCWSFFVPLLHGCKNSQTDRHLNIILFSHVVKFLHIVYQHSPLISVGIFLLLV
jgi:hypothetical protein